MSPPPDQRDPNLSAKTFVAEEVRVRPAPWSQGPQGRATAWPPGIDGTVGDPRHPEPQTTDEATAGGGLDEAAARPVPAGPCPHCEATREAAATANERLVESLLEPYTLAAQTLERATQELTDRFAENVVALAARMATAILHRDAEIDEQALIENIQRALQVAGPVTTLTLRCHAEDADAIRKSAPGLAAEISGRPVEVTVRPSGDVDRGSCIVLFEEGIVDARWQVQIDRLSAAVRTTMTGQPLRPGRPSRKAQGESDGDGATDERDPGGG